MNFVYTRKSVGGSTTIFLILYVDAILTLKNDIPTLKGVKSLLDKCFEMKDLGETTYIIDINIFRDSSKCLIRLSKNTYIDKVLKRFKMEN